MCIRDRLTTSARGLGEGDFSAPTDASGIRANLSGARDAGLLGPPHRGLVEAARADPRRVRRLLISQSTNLHNMSRDPFQVLIASASGSTAEPLIGSSSKGSSSAWSPPNRGSALAAGCAPSPLATPATPAPLWPPSAPSPSPA